MAELPKNYKLPPCRFCGEPLRHSFIDLGMSPLCETYIAPEDLNKKEDFFPLHAFVCSKCFLVQLDEYVAADEIFSEYAYFSSYSDSWVRHAKNYVEMAANRFRLDSQSMVVEVASNDGYLLQHVTERNIPCLGIEPAANIAKVAVDKGIPTEVRFFGVAAAQYVAAKYGHADLLAGNNVLAHVPDLNDFVAGIKILLASDGVATMEFPHLMRLEERNQFDTIYHEHFCYFSFLTIRQVFRAHKMTLFDVEELGTHGGSLRIYAKHAEDESKQIEKAVGELAEREIDMGFGRLEKYFGFAEKVKATKRKLLTFLIDAKDRGMSVVGYGAPGKGNTLLNYCGIYTDMLDYTVDRNTYKQGKFTPGTRIPILAPSAIRETKPDLVLVLPWNLKDEILSQMAYVREWGGRFVIPIPEVEVVD